MKSSLEIDVINDLFIYLLSIDRNSVWSQEREREGGELKKYFKMGKITGTKLCLVS